MSMFLRQTIALNLYVKVTVPAHPLRSLSQKQMTVTGKCEHEAYCSSEICINSNLSQFMFSLCMVVLYSDNSCLSFLITDLTTFT